ncbi:MAG TPA: hypothetical protein ENG69_01235 [Candidatus Korarchaeota archaeon]|nr:hypothetical protein [Candidatus Korarchaeota archaeon]
MSSRIMLDSTVFKERSFLAWLRLNSDRFSVYISPVVYAETALWYIYSGLGAEDLEEDLKALKAEVPPISREAARLAAETAYANRRRLPFRHHARDYIIGAQAVLLRANIITHNRGHFEWVKEVRVMTPWEFVDMFVS